MLCRIENTDSFRLFTILTIVWNDFTLFHEPEARDALKITAD